MNLQTAIFESISQQFPKKADAVAAVSQLLSLQQNAVYRRMRGDTPLLPEEIKVLAQHFQLSLDALLYQQSDKLLFDYPALYETPKNFAEYLNNLATQISALPSVNGYLKYASAEIPVYHYCFFPEIIAFKLYAWGRTTWNFPHLQNQPFSLALMSPVAYQAAANFSRHYLNVPSTELWTLNALDNTLNQLAHCVLSGNMKAPKEGLILCDKLVELVHHLKKMAAAGKKFPVGAKAMDKRTAFTLFHNETIYTGNSILVFSDVGNMVYSTFTNPNFIKSANKKAVAEMDAWFDRITTQSELISKHAEKNRQLYFNILEKKIQRTRLKIQRFIEEDFVF